MFSLIKIQNFQKHTKLKIELDRITSFCGESDLGKSAIIRALRWVCLNQPQGDGFITDGASGVHVQLVAEEHTIGRKRTKNENLYRLDGEDYKSFGSGIPDPIQQILNVSEINFQGQHDPPFWLSLSPGEVSRQLNAIVDLGIIDKALAGIKSKVRSATETVKVCNERLKQAETKRDDLAWVKDCQEEFTKVQELDATRTHRRAKAGQLRTMRDNLHALEQTRHKASSQALASQNLVKLGARLIDGKRQVGDLQRIISECRRLQQIEKPDTETLDKSAKQISEIQQKFERFRSLICRIEESTEILVQRIEALRDANENLSRLTKDQTCPICGGKFDEPLQQASVVGATLSRR